MEVILLEKINKLGEFGETVKVKKGYARNFLLPMQKALHATESNLKKFEERRKELEKEQKARLDEANKNFKEIDGIIIKTLRNASEDGRLYGSVSHKDVANYVLEMTKIKIDPLQVVFSQKSREIGYLELKFALHPDVTASGLLVVGRTDEEVEQILNKKAEDEKKAASKGNKSEGKEGEESAENPEVSESAEA